MIADKSSSRWTMSLNAGHAPQGRASSAATCSLLAAGSAAARSRESGRALST